MNKGPADEEIRQGTSIVATHDLIPYIPLHHNLILPLRVLGHRAAGRKLAREKLCYFLQV
jgi:hypothetical protein